MRICAYCERPRKVGHAVVFGLNRRRIHARVYSGGIVRVDWNRPSVLVMLSCFSFFLCCCSQCMHRLHAAKSNESMTERTFLFENP